MKGFALRMHHIGLASEGLQPKMMRGRRKRASAHPRASDLHCAGPRMKSHEGPRTTHASYWTAVPRTRGSRGPSRAKRVGQCPLHFRQNAAASVGGVSGGVEDQCQLLARVHGLSTR